MAYCTYKKKLHCATIKTTVYETGSILYEEIINTLIFLSINKK